MKGDTVNRLFNTATALLNGVVVTRTVSIDDDGEAKMETVELGQLIINRAVVAVLWAVAVGIQFLPFGNDADINRMVTDLLAFASAIIT
jgi:hypothetical protein